MERTTLVPDHGFNMPRVLNASSPSNLVLWTEWWLRCCVQDRSSVMKHITNTMASGDAHLISDDLKLV